ncbi:uncharacterized protein LOC106709986 [Papilio machaon]|uniref:uncharacterized protein LOC106709986 n=1 Tax=Papilio machaon TaxID=76193 RepID=UPI001E665AEF|nr:uncharacterized protein LOC106709986 [Papilio machaon]
MRRNPRRQCRVAECELARPTTSRPALVCATTGDWIPVAPPALMTSSGAAIVGPPLPATSSTTPMRSGRPPPARLESSGVTPPPTAPATGGVVRRMRWHLLNESVMRAYFGATEGGTNLTAYRPKMLSLFQTLHPSVSVTAQRLSDQVRVIQRRHLLDDSVLERLCHEARPLHNAAEVCSVAPVDPVAADVLTEPPSEERDQRCIYRNWEQPQSQGLDLQRPDATVTTAFWSGIWSVPIEHTEGEWLNVVRRSCEAVTEMGPVVITGSDISAAVRSVPNWKSPGPDGLQNFWLKWFRSSHERLAAQFQLAIELGTLPDFMTSGITHLIYKSGCSTDPKNYRPITCLPTIYKLLTSILRIKIEAHICTNNVLSATQNGCKVGSRGTNDCLLIDMAICQQVRRSKKNISMAWIDYKKAYDSVPHGWLSKVLEVYKIHPTLRTFLNSCMGQWTTSFSNPGQGNLSTSSSRIGIRRGIFQGDSLSPLWFCLALNPLSTLLKSSELGYRLRRGGEIISHLLYMDDLKLYASKKSDLMTLLKITDDFSRAIGMTFGVDKCAVINVQKGKVVASENLQLTQDVALVSLSENESYKYLGMSEALGINDKGMKQLVKERFFCRLKKVLKSLLSGGNKCRAFNSWVMPVLAYSFGILRWSQTELDALDRKVRRLLTAYRMHHPRSSVMRLYIPRKHGGRGYLNAKTLHNREVHNLREYCLKVNVGMYQDVVAMDKGVTPLSLATTNWRRLPVLSVSDRISVWKSKELHGRFHRALTGPDVDQLSSVAWLRFSNLFGETEGFVFAIMDEVIVTNNYRKHILKDGTIDICRACRRPGESIRHIVSGCSRLADGAYLHRHNQVAKIIHQQLALKYALVDTEVPYYQYQPSPVLENSYITLYWDRSIITDRTITANRPDIVIIDRSEGCVMLVDVTIPHDENLVKAEKEKLLKYLDLAHEITAMWRMKSTTIIPIVVSVIK